VADLVEPTQWRDRSVLVTGATGLLGGWLTRRLTDAGAAVVCLVRDAAPASQFSAEGLAERCRAAAGDVTDQALLERLMGEYEVETVFHLAAQTVVGVANRNPVSTLESNIRGTWTVLEAARRSPRVTEIVVASSDKAYGDQPRIPYTEDMPLQGRHPYDVSKTCADLIAASYATTFDLPVAVTRCGNLFGGGDENYNRLVPGVIRDVLRGRRPQLRSDGTLLRDYLYVEDAAEAYLVLAQAMMAGNVPPGSAYNFSMNEPMTVLDMAKRILRAAGSSLEPEVLGSASHEIHAQWLDSTKAREQFGWEPSVGVDAGLARALDWYAKRLSGAA